MALNAPYTPNTTIQSTQVSNDLTGLSNGTNDTANNSMSTFRGEVILDHVNSGCVWSGDSYAATRNASQTSGVVYISGVRLTVAAVSARSFTASKDTYIDVNGSGVQVYTEVTNNAASPALSAGSIRIGIIITGATTIAAATSVNQGQETMILPIASSIAYSVTDSLGNLICCRDPAHKLIGYRQIISTFSSSTIAGADITGLSIPFIAPGNRKVKCSFVPRGFLKTGSGGDQIWTAIFEGATQLASAFSNMAGSNFETASSPVALVTPSAGSHTYKAVAGATQAGTMQVICGSTQPAILILELD